jgi:methyl-accepting chemotaxis protein
MEKMKRNKFISRRFLISLICIFFFILLTFLIIDGYFNLKRDLKIHSASTIDMVDQRTTSLLFKMNIFPQDIGDDLLFLSELSSLKELINSPEGEPRNLAIKSLEEDFLGFIKGSTAYYQLRYIDEKGDEIVRTEFDGNNYKLISKNELQNKKGGYYFEETVKLNKGKIYISQLDLNVENDVIENRGTEENPVYVPVIRVATPVFNNEESKGIVIFNIYADYFLDNIRRAKRDGESVFLIDKEGYYLCHPDREKEFAFMFDRNDNFYNDYPEVSEEILLDYNKKIFKSEDLIFSFRYIYPTVLSSRINNLDEDYSWILVTVSEKTEINQILSKLKKDYLYFLLFSCLIILIIIALVFILIFKSPEFLREKK